jgi:predicted nucleotidyltransferase
MINTGLNLHPEIEKAILFGSRAKGNYKPASDIDLTLVGDDLTLTIQQTIENELDDLLLPYKFDISIYHTISSKELLDHIERIGQLFF